MWEVIPGVDVADYWPGTRIAARRDAIFRRVLSLTYVLVVYMALLIDLYLLAGTARPLLSDVMLAPFVVVMCKWIGLYDRDQHPLSKATSDELFAIFNLAVLCSLRVWLAESLLFIGALDRPPALVCNRMFRARECRDYCHWIGRGAMDVTGAGCL